MISIKNCTIQAGNFRISEINLEIPTGHYGILMGKTGSGKTTILEAVCGLRKIASGQILIDGEDVTHKRPAERNIGFLPQDIALFDHLSVYDHIAFGMRIQKWPKQEVEYRVEELAEQLQITHLLKRKPAGLSGGEKQRTAMGRALSVRPKVLCLDEPLSTLDDDTHDDVIQLIQSVTSANDITSLHITHRKSEANLLGDYFFQITDRGVIQHQKCFS
ncbi:MAG: ABC transporter ATP-binding protein [Lentisphaeria bacterium]|nr:ABC transporter ATP-binding protein [Lentisphaeria bacterium]